MPLPAMDFPGAPAPFDMYPGAPAALIVTEGFRLCSPRPEVELVGVLPFTIVGELTAGTAGGMAIRPFTDELVSSFPYCDGITPDGLELPDAEGGEKVLFVALA